MKNKAKQFFKLIKYETIRVMRNKVVFTMLVLFSIVMLLALSFIQINTDKYPIAIFTNGVNIEESGVVQLIEENINTSKVVYVNTKEEGLDKIKRADVCFFICLVAGNTPEETTAIFYYDQTNTVGQAVASKLTNAKNEFAYESVTNFLNKYGITLNESYFQMVSFAPASEKQVTIRQMPFAIEVTCCMSIILMLGLAYSLARDNETNVSKNIAYIPVGTNRYLWSKLIPYLTLGILEMTIMCLLGMVFFDIQYQINFFIIILLSSFFIMATLMLGLLFSLFKSQISTIFIDMLAILVPTFVSVSVYVQACPLIIQILLYFLPITPFITFLNCLMFNGIILWWNIPIFLLQAITYYLLALLILKKRIRE